MHRLRRAVLGGTAAVSLVATMAAPAAAQGFAIHGQGGYFGLTATNSAKAVFDSSSGFIGGGGLSYAFGKRFYVEAGARYFSKSGEKVFVAGPGDPVFKLGFPLEVRLIPVYGTIGYRFLGGKSAFVPYLGLGGGLTSYREESTVAGIVTTTSQSKASFHGVLGLEYGKGHLRFAVEGLYTSVPNAIGVGGVSKIYGEDDLGGFVALGKLIYSFGTR